MDIKLHKEDLLSMLVSTTRLDTKVAHGVLHFSQSTLVLAICITKSTLGRVCNTHSSSENVSFWI